MDQKTLERIGNMVCDDETLLQVVTATEAVKLWQVSRSSITWNIWRDKLPARLAITGGTWLLTAEGLSQLYGDPVNDIEKLWTPGGEK